MENAPSTSASDHINFNIALTYIKSFASFLLERIEEVSQNYFELYYQRKPDLINLFDASGKNEIKELLKGDLVIFLENILSGKPLEKELQKIEKGNVLYPPGIPKEVIYPLDDSLKFNLINKVFYKYLPQYSSDTFQAMEVLKELEEIQLYFKYKITSLQIDQNQQNIKKERDFAESLINHSTNGIISFNNVSAITMWNKVMETMSGIKREFVLGKKIFDLFPEYRETEEGSAISAVLNGEKVFISERAFASERGFYEANAIPILGVEGEVIGGFIIFNDTSQKRLAAQKIQQSKASLEELNEELVLQINELKKAQDQLKSNEKLLKKTQQLAHLGTWVWHVKKNRIKWSGELREIFGVSEPFTVATIKTYMLKVHPEDRNTILRRIRDAVRSQNPFDYEHRVVLPDGTIRYIHGEGIPEIVEDEIVITGFAQDITLKMKAIETLQASENRFRALCEKSPDAIFLVDKENILYCNYAAVSMLGGKAKGQVLKHSFLDLANSDDGDSQQIRENINKAFNGNSLRFESMLNKFNNELLWTEIIFTPIKLEEKDILHVVIRDISVRKAVENEIKIAHEKLEKINNELEYRIEERTKDLEEINANLMRVNSDMDNFIYSASHDLKAPILNIEGLINELVQNPCYAEGEVKMLIDMMMLCVQKFTRTINDLTNVTKTLRSDSEDIHPVNLEEMISDIKISIQNLIISSEAKISYDFSDCKSIVFSRHSLYSLLYNLINNGIKYRSPQRTPHIFIETREMEDFVELSVKDNGLGLRESDRGKIFLMFKRAHNHVEGSGVGLYLVKRIMENAGGKVEIESEVGVGSRFKLLFKKVNI